jgi:23S rRNA (uracil1939-C5)-methyltransferase
MELELTCTALANGGDGIGRHPDGRVMFLTGALPNEEVRVHITQNKKDFARATVTEVLQAAPERETPSCPEVAKGCGGCGWQHVTPAAQTNFKRTVVVDALRRIAKLHRFTDIDADTLVTLAPPLPVGGHRTTVRAAIRDGRAGFRRAGSSDIIVVDGCETAHPRLVEIMAGARFTDVDEVTLRYSIRTGKTLLIADPSAQGVNLEKVPNPRSITILGADEVEKSAASLTESIDGVDLRVSAGSFFQTRTDGAQQLVRIVSSLVDDERSAGTNDRRGSRGVPVRADLLIDLYGGVGLFAATVGRDFDAVLCVERSELSASDAEHNLLSHHESAVVCVDVDRWDAEPYVHERYPVVVADPARAGLGARGVETLLLCESQVVVLISCDAASYGRDTALLAEAGYELRQSIVVDMFPETPHVEIVSKFVRTHIADGYS